MEIRFRINGREETLNVDPWRRLLDVVRDDLGLTGTKEGCGEGECGACTVTIEGTPVNSCLVAVGQVEGRAVGTIEGLAADGVLHAVQRALIDHGGTQCGICTPGIALCAARVMEAEAGASRARWRELLAGNLCRCTGYQRIIDAVIAASEARR